MLREPHRKSLSTPDSRLYSLRISFCVGTLRIMFCQGTSRMNRSWPAVLLLVVAGLFSCAEVEASCGDYLTDHLSRERGMSGYLSGMEDHAEGDAPEQRTCRGPGCRNRSELPANPAPKVNSVQDDWACRVELLPAEINRSGVEFLEGTLPRASRGAALGIFRPPRVSLLDSSM